MFGLPVLTRPAQAAVRRSGRRPKRIIHLVSDGMSSGTLTCADHLSRLIRKRPLTWIELYQREGSVVGLVDMRSLNSLVTDSAAASSTWGCGSRVKNGAVNMLPDGRPLRPVCSLFGEAGWARGLVTTTEITHATPAGFAANVTHRDKAQTIALQYLERRIEVLLGGGRKYFESTGREDKRDLKSEYRAWGYEVVEDRQGLAAASLGGRWLGMFASGHLPFTVDREASADLQAEVPTLAEMTRRALDRLDRYGRFLLQVEGGRVDHGAHDSDAAGAFYDQIAFDEALDVCLEYQRREPETLLVMTTDHGNSNPGLNGMGTDYAKSPELLSNLVKVQASFSQIETRLLKAAGAKAKGKRRHADDEPERDVLDVAPGMLADVLEEATGYRLPKRRAGLLASYLRGDAEPLYASLDTLPAQLGQVLANYLGIGWTGNAHTSDHVNLLAIGPGAERFRGFYAGTEVFRRYTDLAGIKFRNPEVPLLAESRPSAAEVESG